MKDGSFTEPSNPPDHLRSRRFWGGRLARLQFRLTVWFLSVSFFSLHQAHGLEKTTEPPVARVFKILLIPYDLLGVPGVPARPGWLTQPYVHQAFFQPNFAPMDGGGTPLASGSIRDFFARQFPGLKIQGETVPIPVGMQVDGFYQFNAATADVTGLVDEAVTFQWARVMLNRLGYGNGPEQMNNVFGEAAPLKDALQRHNAQALCFVASGIGTGSSRTVDGINTLFGTVGTGPTLNYEWLGILTHESGHAIGFDDDEYIFGYENENGWNLMANGYGPFPASFTSWHRHRSKMPRVESSLHRGEGGVVALPPYQPGIQPLPESLMLPQGTVSNDGRDEMLFIDHRKRLNPTSAMDTALTGLPDPANNSQGLFIQSVDWRASSWFSAADFTPLGSEVVLGPAAFHPFAAMRSASGSLYPDRLFRPGQPFLGALRNNMMLNRFRSSTNLDGNVLWQIAAPSTQVGTEALTFDVQWAGLSLAQEAAELGTGASPLGAMNRSEVPSVNGSFYQETLIDPTFGIPWLKALRVKSNTTGSSFSARIRWPHFPSPQGEVLVFTPRPLASSSGVTVTLRLLNRDGLSVRQLTIPPGFLTFISGAAHLDLTVLGGQLAFIEMEATSTAAFDLALVDAWYFRKGENTLRLLSQEGGPPPGPGVAGRVQNITMEDGVTYDHALNFQVEGSSTGVVQRTFEKLAIPLTGALLRGSVGFPKNAVGVSDGAVLKVWVNDGLRLWPEPSFGLNAGHALVCPSLGVGVPATYQTVVDWGLNAAWSSSKAWTDGDWVRAGDVDADLDMDLVIFSPDGKVSVARSMNTAFGPPRLWMKGWFGGGDFPLAADINGDGRVDILRCTPEGSVFIATASVAMGGQFAPQLNAVATDVVRPGEVPLAGDVNRDGRADLVVFTLETATAAGLPDRAAGIVRVYRGKPDAGLEPAQIWSTQGIAGKSVTPLLGDFNQDGFQDAIYITANGSASYQLSSGISFDGAPPAAWLINGPEHSVNDPIHIQGTPYPGPRYSTGDIPFFSRTGGPGSTPCIIYFKQTQLTPGRVLGDVKRVTQDTAPGTGIVTALRGSIFILNKVPVGQWPIVADFSGDGVPDLLAMSPNVTTSLSLYVSPKPFLSFENKAAQNNPATMDARLNRFELDLNSYAGQDVDLIVEVSAGPNSDAGDQVIFPELKLYGRAQQFPLGPPVPTQIDPSVIRLMWSAEDDVSEILESDNLSQWSPSGAQWFQAGSVSFVDFSMAPPRKFWRLTRPEPTTGGNP